MKKQRMVLLGSLALVILLSVVLIILMITISAFYSLQKTPLVERLRIID